MRKNRLASKNNRFGRKAVGVLISSLLGVLLIAAPALGTGFTVFFNSDFTQIEGVGGFHFDTNPECPMTLEIDYGNNGSIDLSLPPRDLDEDGVVRWFAVDDGFTATTEGDRVILSQGSPCSAVTKEHIVVYLTLNEINRASDTVAGSARAGTEVSVRVDGSPPTDLEGTADASGNWSVDFSGEVDIIAGTSGWALVGDGDGDHTQINFVVKAVEIEYGHVFRDNRVYEPDAFIGVTDRDRVGTSSEVDVGTDNPDDYEVHLTSSSGIVDMYLIKYRQLSSTSWEYVGTLPITIPESDLEDVWYQFELVYASDHAPVGGVGLKYWYIPDGDITNPVPIPDPNSVVLSGDCSSLHIEWENVLGNVLPAGPYTGHYSMRVYLLNPDGSLNYAIYTYQFGKWAAPEFDLPVSLCDPDCGSWAIGIQSRINFTGADPLGGGLVNRSQYYFRYDACHINVDIDIKPGSYPNCFNNDGKGAIPVAILSSVDFDATQVNPDTIALDGQGMRVVGRDNTQAHIEDVNGDGLNDLMVQIADVDGTYVAGNSIAVLTAETVGGESIKGTDSVCIVP